MLANAGGGRYACHMSICYVDSPVGRLAVEADQDAVTSVRWTGADESARDTSMTPVLCEAGRQLERYFAGKLKRFDLPLAARGTDFQKSVWKMMCEIPFGGTATYGGKPFRIKSGRQAHIEPVSAIAAIGVITKNIGLISTCTTSSGSGQISLR